MENIGIPKAGVKEGYYKNWNNGTMEWWYH